MDGSSYFLARLYKVRPLLKIIDILALERDLPKVIKVDKDS